MSGERADDPHRRPVRIVRDLAAGREPADGAVLKERAVFRLEGAAAVERAAQRMDDGLEVLRMDGREPVVARERQAVETPRR